MLAWFPMLAKGLDIQWVDVVPQGLDAEFMASTTHGDDVGERFMQMLCLHDTRHQLSEALLISASLGVVGIMECLLQHRAHVAFARKRTSPKVMYMAGQQPIHAAAQCGHTDAVGLLLRYRAGVDALDRTRSTPLFFAATAGCCRTAQCLLESRSNIDHVSDMHGTALAPAIVFGRAAVLRHLIRARAHLDISPLGITCLHYAALYGPGVEVVHILVKARANLDHRFGPRFGSIEWLTLSALQLPWHFGSRGFVASAVYHVWGSTPLMWAVMNGNVTEASALLAAGADPNVRNSRGFDSRQLARAFDSPVFEAQWHRARLSGAHAQLISY